MKKIILIIVLLHIYISGIAQEADIENTPVEAKNAVNISYGGAGIFFSAIYERHVIAGQGYNFGIKGGIGSSFSAALFPHEFSFPVGAFFLYGKGRHHLDVSMNVTSYLLEQYSYVEDKTNKELRLLYVPSVCYRFQKPEGGFTGRFGISPVININGVTNSFMPWVDVSLGWAF